MEENQNSKGLVLRKIELKVFIDTLVQVYNSGADYIDIVGNPDEKQDTIGIIVHDEYMSEDQERIEIIDEYDDDEEEIDEEPFTKIDSLTGEIKKLSDEDINNLI